MLHKILIKVIEAQQNKIQYLEKQYEAIQGFAKGLLLGLKEVKEEKKND